MTNPIFTSIRFQPADINGLPLAGAILYFFQAQTTTPITVYQDAALGTPWGVSVTADAEGAFAAIYAAPQIIKTQLYDANAVLIQTIDNITLGAGDSTLILKQSTNPTPTAEGDIQWDTNDDRIAVGNGGGTSTFSNDATNATLYLGTASIATSAQYLANTASKVIGPNAVWGALTPVVLTPGTTVTADLNLGQDFTLTPVQSFTLANFSNPKQGQRGRIVITQDGTGSRVISWGGNFVSTNGQKPILSTAAGVSDTLYYDCETTSRFVVSLNRNVS